MRMTLNFWRRRSYLRRVDEAWVWQEAQRSQAAEHLAAVRRILEAGRPKR